jgi:hypothetical protein
MKAIDNSSALNYCHANANILNAVVAFLVGGAKYTSAPTVTFSGGGGSGAAATAIVTNGQVTGLTITNGGTGYTSVPTIAFSGGGGSGAAATAVLTSQVVTSATVTNKGGKTLTITDNTTYPSGDSRKAVNITVADKFGVTKEFQIDDSPASVTINIADAGLNDVDGIDVLATVVSLLHMHKNGSVNDTVTLKTAGNLVMDK